MYKARISSHRRGDQHWKLKKTSGSDSRLEDLVGQWGLDIENLDKAIYTSGNHCSQLGNHAILGINGLFATKQAVITRYQSLNLPSHKTQDLLKTLCPRYRPPAIPLY